MKIYEFKYTEVVRVEIKDLKTNEIRSISFCQTTLEEVISHVRKKLKVGLTGIKAKVNIRISHHQKRWGNQKIFTVYIKNLDTALKQIKANVPTLKG